MIGDSQDVSDSCSLVILGGLLKDCGERIYVYTDDRRSSLSVGVRGKVDSDGEIE